MTVAQFRQFVQDEEYFKEFPDERPPCYVRTFSHVWFDPSGTGYRLPSEAEWEYACRSGSGSAYCFGDDRSMLESYAVYGDVRTQRTGSKLPNARGLFDMHGNLYEWCNDWYDSYSSDSVFDPTGVVVSASRVNRGGNWSFSARYCRSAHRGWNSPGIRYSSLGFRVAAVQSSQ